MNGTIRSLDAVMRKDVHERMRRTVKLIAESAGASADIDIITQTLVNFNNPSLTKKIVPALQKSVGVDRVIESGWVTAAEDFSFYGEKAPSFFFSLGGLARDKAPKDATQHHTPDFYLDESGFILGVKTFCNILFDYANLK